MCGRYSQQKSAEIIAEMFQVDNVPPLKPRYNIAPTQSVATILQTAENRQFKLLHWGLIPNWAKDTKISSKLINARAETVAEKPSFRSAFRRQRCLILADGFYEWQQQEDKQKQPFYFQMSDQSPFAFAGLWEHWKAQETGETIESCTIITTEPNELMKSVHNRMPVILEPKNYDLWLDREVKKLELLQPLLNPYPAEEMTAFAVSKVVNKPSNDTAECINSI
ncbi:MAG: SOS response-associated peptidase [Coleofasciculaceae cyanobacterium]